jgi:LuxR family maltose regulon positive regulatory protein
VTDPAGVGPIAGSARDEFRTVAGRGSSARRGSYPRQRIALRIQEAASYGIALIVAAAGYGKTEALRHTYHADSALILELDDRITTIEPFLKKLIGAAAPRHARSFAALLEKTAPDAACEVLVPWVAARLRGVEPAIVIDDLHRLFRDERAPAALQQLIESTRHSVTWVLSSRETPELPIGTWIAREWMHRPISSSDLAFRDDEAQALADLLGISIVTADLNSLVEDTGGWPIALRLSLTTWDDARDRIPSGMRTRDVLFRYIDEQVWRTVGNRCDTSTT